MNCAILGERPGEQVSYHLDRELANGVEVVICLLRISGLEAEAVFDLTCTTANAPGQGQGLRLVEAPRSLATSCSMSARASATIATNAKATCKGCVTQAELAPESFAHLQHRHSDSRE